jgi:hypothetical protein
MFSSPGLSFPLSYCTVNWIVVVCLTAVAPDPAVPVTVIVDVPAGVPGVVPPPPGELLELPPQPAAAPIGSTTSIAAIPAHR